jgi:hypothetical protein
VLAQYINVLTAYIHFVDSDVLTGYVVEPALLRRLDDKQIPVVLYRAVGQLNNRILTLEIPGDDDQVYYRLG